MEAETMAWQPVKEHKEAVRVTPTRLTPPPDAPSLPVAEQEVKEVPEIDAAARGAPVLWWCTAPPLAPPVSDEATQDSKLEDEIDQLVTVEELRQARSGEIRRYCVRLCVREGRLA